MMREDSADFVTRCAGRLRDFGISITPIAEGLDGIGEGRGIHGIHW